MPSTERATVEYRNNRSYPQRFGRAAAVKEAIGKKIRPLIALRDDLLLSEAAKRSGADVFKRKKGKKRQQKTEDRSRENIEIGQAAVAAMKDKYPGWPKSGKDGIKLREEFKGLYAKAAADHEGQRDYEGPNNQRREKVIFNGANEVDQEPQVHIHGYEIPRDPLPHMNGGPSKGKEK